MHGHEVSAALKMLVIENGAAHDGQRRIAPDKVIWQKVDKIEKFIGRAFVYLHGNVPLIDDDAVLVVIRIRRILHEPPFPAEREPDGAQIPARSRRPLKPFVLLTERARGIFVPLGCGEKFGNVFVVLFRFGKVYSDLQPAFSVVVFPSEIARDRRFLHISAFDR